MYELMNLTYFIVISVIAQILTLLQYARISYNKVSAALQQSIFVYAHFFGSELHLNGIQPDALTVLVVHLNMDLVIELFQIGSILEPLDRVTLLRNVLRLFS